MIPNFIILNTGELTIAIVIVALSILSLTKLKFPHLVKVQYMRSTTWLLGTIYFFSLTWLSLQFPKGPSSLKPVLVLFPMYILGLSIAHTWKVSRRGVPSLNAQV